MERQEAFKAGRRWGGVAVLIAGQVGFIGVLSYRVADLDISRIF